MYRGTKGGVLPKEFFEPNVDGVCGGVEYAYSSFTFDQDVAIDFADGSSGTVADASTVFEARMGMVDRGAFVWWLSQYPEEAEVRNRRVRESAPGQASK